MCRGQPNKGTMSRPESRPNDGLHRTGVAPLSARLAPLSARVFPKQVRTTPPSGSLPLFLSTESWGPRTYELPTSDGKLHELRSSRQALQSP